MNKYKISIIVILSLMILATAGLIVLEMITPGTCPPYPFLGFPTCIVLEVYFVIMMISLFIKNIKLGNIIFYSLNILSLITSIYFSAREFLNIAQCPRFFDINLPLCYTALAGSLVLLTLKIVNDYRR